MVIEAEDMQEKAEQVRVPAAGPRTVPWPAVWVSLVTTIRALAGIVVWEVFAGSATLSKAFREQNVGVAPPLDVLFSEDFNLLNPLFLAVVLGILLEGLITFLHLAPPCSTFGISLNSGAHRVRSAEFVEGLPGLDEHKSEKVRLGNALAEVAATLLSAQVKAKGEAELEQPPTSLMRNFGPVAKAIEDTGVEPYIRDACVDGAPWRKPLCLWATSRLAGERFQARCRGGHKHLELRGKNAEGVWWTRVACPYWPDWARSVVEAWLPILRVNAATPRDYRPVKLVTPPVSGEDSVLARLKADAICPSGRRTAERVADITSSGRQAPGWAIPQLVPDGLTPEQHLEVGLATQNPLAWAPSSTGPVEYALKYRLEDPQKMNEQRRSMTQAVKDLAQAVRKENEWLVSRTHPDIRVVLEAWGDMKNICLMRELHFVTGNLDYSVTIGLVLGLPMLGWTAPAAGNMERVRAPLVDLAEWEASRGRRNAKVMAVTGPSGDDELDRAAWAKSLKELELKVIQGPYENFDDLPVQEPSLAPRQGIWEAHGAAVERSVRVIDNLLLGEQNETTGSTHSHRPTDVDALMAQTRVVAEASPSDELSGWPSDYEKAYKQVPAKPAQKRHVVLAQWNPLSNKICFWLVLSQVFGGRTPPINFARYPAWFCWIMACLFSVAVSHCVDDVICVERRSTVMSGWRAWLMLCEVSGWRISADKSPPPFQHGLRDRRDSGPVGLPGRSRERFHHGEADGVLGEGDLGHPREEVARLWLGRVPRRQTWLRPLGYVRASWPGEDPPDLPPSQRGSHELERAAGVGLDVVAAVPAPL